MSLPDPIVGHTRPPGFLLLVDDDPTFAQVLARALQRRGFAVHTAASIEAATSLLAASPVAPGFAILDLNLAGVSGLKMISAIRERSADCRILILTGYASIATAVDAIKLGADEYLAKPADVEAITRALLGDEAPDDEAAPQDVPSLQRLEWEHIQRVLTEHEGNISSAARALKMHRRTLQRKLSKRPARE